MSKPPKEIRPDLHKDYELMKRIAAKDEAAFIEFDKQYRNLIFTTAFKVIANRQECEDITNEVLLTVWNKAEQFNRHRGKLVTWVCTTTRNRAIDKLRSINRKTKLYDDYKETELAFKDSSNCGFSNILRSDTRDYLNKRLDSLPPNQREVIRLIYFEGLTQKQVSERLDRPIGTVKAQMTRGLERMRKQVASTALVS